MDINTPGERHLNNIMANEKLPKNNQVKPMTPMNNTSKSQPTSSKLNGIPKKRNEASDDIKKDLQNAIGSLNTLLKSESLTRKSEIFKTLEQMEVLVSKLPPKKLSNEQIRRTPSVAVEVSTYFKED